MHQWRFKHTICVFFPLDVVCWPVFVLAAKRFMGFCLWVSSKCWKPYQIWTQSRPWHINIYYMRVSEQAKLYNCTLDTLEEMWFVRELCGVMTTMQASQLYPHYIYASGKCFLQQMKKCNVDKVTGNPQPLYQYVRSLGIKPMTWCSSTNSIYPNFHNISFKIIFYYFSTYFCTGHKWV